MPTTVAPQPITLGSRFRTIQSPVASIPFDAGNVRSVELPRSFLYKMLFARLRGSILTAVATTTPAFENPVGLVRRLDVIADGRKLLMSVGGVDAFRLSNLFQGKHGVIVPAPGVAVASQEIEAGFYLHCEAARMLTPIMSYFDPRPYEKVELRCQWGTVSDIFGTPSTASVNAETALEVQVIQSAEGAENIAFNRLLLFDEINYAAGAISNNMINIPRAGLLAGILIRTYAASGSSVAPTNTFFQSSTSTQTNIVGSLSLKSDNNFLHVDNINPTTLQYRNVSDYALDVPVPTGSPSGAAPNLPPVGYYYLDLTEDGLMTSLLNTFDLNVLQLIVSNQGSGAPATTMRLTYVFYEPITAG